ncbi:hypothetical protein ACXWR8_09730, partial [Streptococcus pyogenes]
RYGLLILGITSTKLGEGVKDPRWYEVLLEIFATRLVPVPSRKVSMPMGDTHPQITIGTA